MHNEITTMDDALTRPWTVTRTYRRHSDEWSEYVCAATNQHVAIGHDDYLLSADGALMPVKKVRDRRTCDISMSRSRNARTMCATGLRTSSPKACALKRRFTGGCSGS
jgi:hypothetical protein